jgi:hypothetical protein
MSDLDQLATALAAAQAEMANPKFDRVNPGFRSKYASLAAVRDAVIPVLAKHGIACIQNLTTTEGGICCTTMLLHKSGQSLISSLPMPASKQDAQGLGSAATYARRYSLMAMVGVVGDEDDDGNAAVASVKPPHPAMVAQAPMPDYSVQEAALRHCASLSSLQETWKALSAAERRALSAIKDQVKAQIEMADAAAATE